MNIEGFSRILNRTVVPSSLSVEEQERKLEELERFVSSNLAMRLNDDSPVYDLVDEAQ